MKSVLKTDWRYIRKIKLSGWIFIFMIIGLIVGLCDPGTTSSKELAHISKMFTNMLKCLILPLVFSTAVVGTAGHGDDLKKLGMLALKSIIYFEVATTIALIIGMIAVNFIKPGNGIDLSGIVVSGSAIASMGKTVAVTWDGVITRPVPTSFFDAASKNNILQVKFCAVMFAAALTLIESKYKPHMLHFLESLSMIMFKITDLVMNFAPIGVACALAATVNSTGAKVLVILAALIVTLYVSLFIYAVVVFVPVLLLCRVPLSKTFKAIGQPALIAFSTSSSEAALPKSMELMKKFGVSRGTVSFVMPIGCTLNLDGTTLYLALASVFCAQVGRISMPIGQQIVMMLTIMLTSKGVTTAPRASLVILAGTASSFNLPLAAIEVILGVDAIMDMGRTAVNLTGNCVACIAIAVWEGDFDYDIAYGRKEWVELTLDYVLESDIETNYEKEQGVQAEATTPVTSETPPQ